ncbi:MAG: selenium cofactor biosynthesis protein YqeC [Treponema sp.]
MKHAKPERLYLPHSTVPYRLMQQYPLGVHQPPQDRHTHVRYMRNAYYRVSLTDRLCIQDGDIVSFIGSGGKTTSIITVANELQQRGKRVAVTTTTKMGLREQSRLLPDVAFFGTEQGEKILAPPLDAIPQLTAGFSAVLIEADGSKQKAVKGWNSTEPVILPNTSKTVGVISVRTLGKPVTERWVHRPEYFCCLTRAKPAMPLQLHHLIRVIQNPDGLFFAARGHCFVLCIAPRRYHEKIRTAYYRARGRRFGKRGSCGNPYFRFSCPCTGN